MIDLTSVPLEELKAELARRKEVAKEVRKKALEEKVCCRNCAYRIQGKTNGGPLQSYDSWVCYKRPKKTKNNYFDNVPKYNQAYWACGPQYKGCPMFVHKKSVEGENITRKISSMDDRIS